MTRCEKVKIVNIVGSEKKIDVSLDLAAVAEDLQELEEWIESVEHSRRSGNRLLIHFAEGETRGILTPTGVYVLTGVDSHEEVDEARRQLLCALTALGIISNPDLSQDEIVYEFVIQNVVCTGVWEKS